MGRDYENKLKRWMADREVAAEHLSFEESCHSVAEAARAAGVEPEDLVKSICMIDDARGLVVAVVKGEDRVSTSRVGKALESEPPRMASPDEMLERTGYPCGGTPPFGFEALFLVDPRVLEKDAVYGGGGSERALVRVAPGELLRVNGARVARLRR